MMTSKARATNLEYVANHSVLQNGIEPDAKLVIALVIDNKE